MKIGYKLESKITKLNIQKTTTITVTSTADKKIINKITYKAEIKKTTEQKNNTPDKPIVKPEDPIVKPEEPIVKPEPKPEPNPAAHILNIKLTNTNDLPDSYTVYNILGQIMISKKIDQVDDLRIQTNTFSSGVYYIKLTKAYSSSIIPFIQK